jgi:hypothetical protein
MIIALSQKAFWYQSLRVAFRARPIAICEAIRTLDPNLSKQQSVLNRLYVGNDQVARGELAET